MMYNLPIFIFTLLMYLVPECQRGTRVFAAFPAIFALNPVIVPVSRVYSLSRVTKRITGVVPRALKFLTATVLIYEEAQERLFYTVNEATASLR